MNRKPGFVHNAWIDGWSTILRPYPNLNREPVLMNSLGPYDTKVFKHTDTMHSAGHGPRKMMLLNDVDLASKICPNAPLYEL